MLNRSPRILLWLALVVGALVSASAYGQVTDHFAASPVARVLLFFTLGVCGIALVFCWPAFKKKWCEVGLLLGVSVLLRFALLPTAPSDDIYRYLWEGKLIRLSISPYAQTADSPSIESYRDDYWEQMNHIDKKTAYPPLALLTFAGVGWVTYSAIGLKLFFIAVDCLVIFLLIAALSQMRLPLRWAGFYAFNPVILVSIAGEAHFDVLLVCAMIASWCSFLHQRSGWAWFFLGTAIQFKLMALLLVPFLLKRTRLRSVWPCCLIVILPCLPFASSLSELFWGLNDFATTGSFNGFIYALLLELFESRSIANAMVAIAFLSLLLWRFFFGNPKASLVEDAFFVMGALLVLSPTFHFWYLSWVLVFFVFRPSLAWLVFSLCQCVYFRVWYHWTEEGTWMLSFREQLMLWGPFLLIGAYELRLLWARQQARCSEGDSAPSDGVEPGISVIIPTYNAASVLPHCLAALKSSERPPDEIIIADGGSHDDTKALSDCFEITFLEAPRGRGSQIKAGIEASHFSTVLVIHADSQIRGDALGCVEQFLEHHPEAVGGACGQRFDQHRFSLLFIELLNEARATLKGASFGDQGQFFRRAVGVGTKGFPDIALMEDVEMSQRMLGCGYVGYLGCEFSVSADKWNRQGWWNRFKTVIYLIVQYRIARLFNPNKTREIAQRLYDVYYPSK